MVSKEYILPTDLFNLECETESIGEEFRYDTGKYEQTKTVLTIPEFIMQLERLREYVTETK